MAIVWTYPRLSTTAENTDLLLITDISDDNKTKSVQVNLLPFTNNLGTVTSVALSMPAAFAVANSPITSSGTLSVTTTGGSAGQYLDYTGNWSTPAGGGGGDTYTLQAETKAGSSVPLKLDAATGTDSTVNLTEGSNITLTRNSATEITIASSGGGGSTSPAGSNQQVQYNNSGSFGASSNLTLVNNELVVGEIGGDKGILKVEGEDAVASGEIKIGHLNNSKYLSLILSTDTMAADYSITFPPTAPGSNNKILEATSTGELAWINTPSYSLPLAANGTRGGIQIGYVQNAKNYPLVLSSEKAYVNVPWTDTDTTYTGSSGILLTGTNFTNTDKGSSQYIYKNFAATTGGTATANTNNDTLTIAAGSNITTTRSGDTITIASTATAVSQGFSPMSIYEATDFIQSVAEESNLSVMRQSVCEAAGEIKKVDFFRLSGTNKVSVSVYTGTISGGGTLVLFGEQTTGTANTVNTITFTSTHTFSAGDDIVIIVSLYQTGAGGAQVVGATNLLANSNVSLQSANYISSPNNDLTTEIENGFETASAKGASLHFYHA